MPLVFIVLCYCGERVGQGRVVGSDEACAQVNTALGKLAEQTGNREVAAQHYGEALRAYTTVLQRPESLGGLRERSDVRCRPLQ